MDEPAKLAHVPVEVTEDELARLFLVEDHLVGGEEDHPRHGLEQDGHVLVAPDVVPDDDVRALLDKVLAAAEIDFLGENKRPRHAVDGLLDALEFFLERGHGRGAILQNPPGKFKERPGAGAAACERPSGVLI